MRSLLFMFVLACDDKRAVKGTKSPHASKADWVLFPPLFFIFIFYVFYIPLRISRCDEDDSWIHEKKLYSYGYAL